MVVVAQLVRVLVCGAEGRRFEPGQPPITGDFCGNPLFYCLEVSDNKGFEREKAVR